MQVLRICVLLSVVLSLDAACSCKDWKMVFKVWAGSRAPVYDTWNAAADVNPDNPCHVVFKSPLAENWANVKTVKISVLKDYQEKAYFIFNAEGSTKENFMSKDRLLDSSFNNLAGQTFNFFSAEGDERYDRRFYINKNYGGCPRDFGWLVVQDVGNKAACTWAERAEKPYFLYCDDNAGCNSNTAPIGDIFTISIKEKC